MLAQESSVAETSGNHALLFHYEVIDIHSFSFIRTIFIRTLRLRFASKFKKMYGPK